MFQVQKCSFLKFSLAVNFQKRILFLVLDRSALLKFHRNTARSIPPAKTWAVNWCAWQVRHTPTFNHTFYVGGFPPHGGTPKSSSRHGWAWLIFFIDLLVTTMVISGIFHFKIPHLYCKCAGIMSLSCTEVTMSLRTREMRREQRGQDGKDGEDRKGGVDSKSGSMGTFFSWMRSKGSRFTLRVWGLRVCSLGVAQPFAPVRNRSRDGRNGRAYGKFQGVSRGHFGGFKRRVASFRVAGVTLCDIQGRVFLLTCRKSFCVVGAILLRRFRKMSCSFRGRRSTSDVSLVILRGRRSTSDVSLVILRGTRSTWDTFHALHSSLYTLNYTPHFALYTPLSTLYTPHSLHSTLYNLHFALGTLHSTLYTPHSTLYTLYTLLSTLHTLTLYTPHSTLHTLHSTLHTLHFTLYTLHSTLYTWHFTLRTPQTTLYTPHPTTLCTLHTPHSTLYTPRSLLYTPHSTLHTLHFPLHTLHFTLRTLHSTLYTLHFTLHTLHSTLYTPHSTLYTPHSTLHTLHSTPHTPHSTLYTLHTPHSTLSTPSSSIFHSLRCTGMVTWETCTRLFK